MFDRLRENTIKRASENTCKRIRENTFKGIREYYLRWIVRVAAGSCDALVPRRSHKKAWCPPQVQSVWIKNPGVNPKKFRRKSKINQEEIPNNLARNPNF